MPKLVLWIRYSAGCVVNKTKNNLAIVTEKFQVGSADNLFIDQSTFMVEMIETAAILKQATRRSFVSCFVSETGGIRLTDLGDYGRGRSRNDTRRRSRCGICLSPLSLPHE
jgi:hypothetical protein